MKSQILNFRFLSPTRPESPSQAYLMGIRGILAIQCFLFVFFQLFLPTAVADSDNKTGPFYQVILRKTLSVLFWNESFIYSCIIFLSARTTCLTFLKNPNRTICASSIFRRAVRLSIPTTIALALSALLFSYADTSYISQFLSDTQNISTTTPKRLTNALHFLNTLFDLFWVTKDYAKQAANFAFPSGTLWIVSVLFQQSYTVYMTMVIIPYTRSSWRVKSFLVFILTAWWVQSWAWYTVSGLLLADMVLNMDFQAKCQRGLRIGKTKVRVPVWLICATLVVAGVLLQFLFVAWRPELRNQELKGHTGLYNSGPLNHGVDFEGPLARDDVYLVVVGLMGLVETYECVKRGLENPVLVALGRRSYSLFLIQPLVLYTAGVKLFLHVDERFSHEISVLVCFVVCAPLVGLLSEFFYRLVDVPSIWAAKAAFEWIRN